MQFIQLFLRLTENKALDMKTILTAILFLIGFQAGATHIVGGEVYYDSLGNDEYRVTFEIYRDCSGSDLITH